MRVTSDSMEIRIPRRPRTGSVHTTQRPLSEPLTPTMASNDSNNNDVDDVAAQLAALLLRAEAAERRAEAADHRSAEERANREAADHRAAKERANREAAEQRAAEERVNREAAEQREEIANGRNERLQQLQDGTYYATLNQVWHAASMEFDYIHFDRLCRKRPPRNVTYTATAAASNNVNNCPANESKSSRSSMNPSEKVQTWPTDIFGNMDISADIAHLIPASAANATMYDDVATLVMGLTKRNLHRILGHHPTDDEFWRAKQLAIHGARPRFEVPAAKPPRISFSGLKHSPLNKLRLGRQRDFYDNHPSVLIIPIMSRSQMIDWNGDPYEALVLVEESDDHSVEEVCGAIRMTKEGVEATITEIEKACQLLRDVLCGLAHSLKSRKRYDDVIRSGGEISAIGRDMLNVLGQVTVPEMADNVRVPRVRKVRFGYPNGHAAPDPFLLATKAAVNWSARHKQQLLAGGEVKDDTDSLSQLAEEQYVEWREQSYRPKTWEDLASGLGQPNGYRPDDTSIEPDCFPKDNDAVVVSDEYDHIEAFDYETVVNSLFRDVTT